MWHFIHYKMYDPPNGRAPVARLRRTLVSQKSFGRSTCQGWTFAGHCVMCFSDTYVFLAIRIICTRQVANCGPGFKRRIYMQRHADRSRSLRQRDETSRATSIVLFYIIFALTNNLWLVASVQFRSYI